MNLESSFSPGILAFGIIAALLMAGVFLRMRIPFLQRFLFPASIIGGTIGIPLMAMGWIPIGHDTFAVIAYHLFNLGVITIALTGNEHPYSKQAFQGAFWIALMWVSILCIQAIAGLGIFCLWNLAGEQDLYPGLGFLTGLGFAQGPGQSLAITSVWELEFSISHAITFGLVFSAVGFFGAFFTGMPLATKGLREGWFHFPKTELSRSFLRGLPDPGTEMPYGQQTTHPANIESLAFHASMVLGLYALSFLAAQGLRLIGGEMLDNLVFGFIFMIGLLLATLARLVMKQLKLLYLIDQSTLKRATGSLIDFGIVPVMLAIQLEIVGQFFIPIGIASLLAFWLTWRFADFFGRRLPLPYKRERALLVYGGTTGTVANSLLILKVIDPFFRTTLAFELVFYNFFAIFTSTHLILLLGILPAESSLSVAHLALVFAITLAVMILLLIWNNRRWH
jgi:ESS family glutamate:Na+ symporter